MQRRLGGAHVLEEGDLVQPHLAQHDEPRFQVKADQVADHGVDQRGVVGQDVGQAGPAEQLAAGAKEAAKGKGEMRHPARARAPHELALAVGPIGGEARGHGGLEALLVDRLPGAQVRDGEIDPVGHGGGHPGVGLEPLRAVIVAAQQALGDAELVDQRDVLVPQLQHGDGEGRLHVHAQGQALGVVVGQAQRLVEVGVGAEALGAPALQRLAPGAHALDGQVIGPLAAVDRRITLSSVHGCASGWVGGCGGIVARVGRGGKGGEVGRRTRRGGDAGTRLSGCPSWSTGWSSKATSPRRRSGSRRACRPRGRARCRRSVGQAKAACAAWGGGRDGGGRWRRTDGREEPMYPDLSRPGLVDTRELAYDHCVKLYWAGSGKGNSTERQEGTIMRCYVCGAEMERVMTNLPFKVTKRLLSS